MVKGHYLMSVVGKVSLCVLSFTANDDDLDFKWHIETCLAFQLKICWRFFSQVFITCSNHT